MTGKRLVETHSINQRLQAICEGHQRELESEQTTVLRCRNPYDCRAFIWCREAGDSVELSSHMDPLTGGDHPVRGAHRLFLNLMLSSPV